ALRAQSDSSLSTFGNQAFFRLARDAAFQREAPDSLGPFFPILFNVAFLFLESRSPSADESNFQALRVKLRISCLPKTRLVSFLNGLYFAMTARLSTFALIT
ncbi:MAG: hypothetical protein ACRECH_07135, partial [Nitrososphaerales archaeon]